MAFTDHKISAFTHTISELADQPNLPPDELKARFDACPEELRVAHNALCDEANRLDERVGGIVDQSFADTITKAMLSSELRSELNAKAVETSVASRINSEKNSRTSADTALGNRISALESAVPLRARVVYGTYTGNGTDDRLIVTGFQPLFVYACRGPVRSFYHAFFSPMMTALCANTTHHSYPPHLEATGFRVSRSDDSRESNFTLNEDGVQYGYIAIGT